MAKVLQTFEFKETTRTGKHDWTLLTDGQIRQLKKGEDYVGKTKWFAVQCRTQAKKRGLLVRLSGHTGDDAGTIVVQFVKRGEASAPAPQTATAGKKGKK